MCEVLITQHGLFKFRWMQTLSERATVQYQGLISVIFLVVIRWCFQTNWQLRKTLPDYKALGFSTLLGPHSSAFLASSFKYDGPSVCISRILRCLVTAVRNRASASWVCLSSFQRVFPNTSLQYDLIWCGHLAVKIYTAQSHWNRIGVVYVVAGSTSTFSVSVKYLFSSLCWWMLSHLVPDARLPGLSVTIFTYRPLLM